MKLFIAYLNVKYNTLLRNHLHSKEEILLAAIISLCELITSHNID